MKTSYRSLGLMLAGFLLAVASPATASEDWTYVGTSSQDEPISFELERRDVLTLTHYDITTTQICDDGSTSHGQRTKAIWPTVKDGVALNGHHLWLSEDDGMPDVFINGTFRARKASGELEVKIGGPCRSGQVFWTAERVRATTEARVYRGTTSQGESIKFRIERQERALVLASYRIPTTQECEDGSSFPFEINAGVEGFVFQGRRLSMVDDYGDYNVHVDGKFRAGSASGTMEMNVFPQVLEDGGRLSCTSGELTWTAEHVPRSVYERLAG